MPTVALRVCHVTTKQVTAATSIIPSMPMFSTPLRSMISSPSAAMISGAAYMSVCCQRWGSTRSQGLTDLAGGPDMAPRPPSLGRAPAEPWRASGLPQDVSRYEVHVRVVHAGQRAIAGPAVEERLRPSRGARALAERGG